MSKVTCGIDFGTSNSAITVGQTTNNVVELIAVEDTKTTIPSAMFFVGKEHQAFFGRQAINKFLDDEDGRFMRSLKRVLGTSTMSQGTVVNGRILKFENVISHFLAHLKKQAESHVGMSIDHVVMGRPVHFMDNNPKGDQRAQDELERMAKEVGFKHVSFQFEPIAAAYAHERHIVGEKCALIVDIGGGTSDFTVIRLSQDRLLHSDRSQDILANTGVRIGGNDLDKQVSLNSFMPEFGYGSTFGHKNLEVPLKIFHDLSEWSKVNFLYTNQIMTEMQKIFRQSHDKKRFGRLLQILEYELGHLLLQIVEETKIGLTTQDKIQVCLDEIEKNLSLEVTKEAFDQAIYQDIHKVCLSAQECILTAGLTVNDIDLIVLTGGTTEVPLVQDMFRQLCPQAQISDHNKLSSVATGLAYDSLRKFG